MEGVYKKLLLIQNSVESFVKNKKSFNFSYVDGNSVLSHIRPLMNDTGLLLKQEILSIDNERYDYVTKKGEAKTEVLSKLMMRFTWIDTETGEKDENLFGANGMNDFDKGVGSAMTYGERYFLLKYFHIPTDADDVDALNRDAATVKNPYSSNKSAQINGTDLPWLNNGSKEYAGAVVKLRYGTTTIDKIQKFYKLSKEVKANLEACTKDLLPEKSLA